MENLTKIQKKHKEFAELYSLNGYNATDAYMQVYQTSSRTSAGTGGSNLLKHPHVQQYLVEFEVAPLDNSIEKSEIIDSVVCIRDKALENGKYADALKANEMLIKLHGYNIQEAVDFGAILQFNFGGNLKIEKDDK